MLKFLIICGSLICLQCFLLVVIHKYSGTELKLVDFYKLSAGSRKNNSKTLIKWLKINETRKYLQILKEERLKLEKQLEELVKNHTAAENEQISLDRKLSDLIDLQNQELTREPSYKYEILRRRVARNIRNFLNYVVHDVKSMQSRFNFPLVNLQIYADNIRDYKL